jgi:hypothetical protein
LTALEEGILQDTHKVAEEADTHKVAEEADTHKVAEECTYFLKDLDSYSFIN